MKNSNTLTLLMESAIVNQKLLRRADLNLGVHGISFTEYLILHMLFQAPSKVLRRVELAESVGITASGITRLLAPMEKIKLVEKQSMPRDARVSLVKLSNAGEQLYRDATETLTHFSEALTKDFKATEIKQMISFNQQLLHNS